MISERSFYGWKLVFILWLLDFLNMGFPLYGGAVINSYMLKEIPMSRSSFGLGFTLLNLFVGIPSILVGASIVRWGIRKTFGIGSALILVGALWLAVITSQPWHYWVGFGVLTATGISFGTIIPAATAVTRWYSLVQPLARKNDGRHLIRVGICRFFRCTNDQPNSDREWRKLAAGMGDSRRNICFIGDCGAPVCERASRRPRPSGGWRAKLGTIGEVDSNNGSSDNISLGASTGVPDTRVLDDSRRRHRLPISVLLLYGPLAAAPERSGYSPCRRCIRHGSLHPRSRLRAADWRLAYGRHGRALRFHVGLLLLFPGVIPGYSSFARSALDRFHRRDSLWNGIWMDLHLPDNRHRSLLRPGSLSKGEWNDAGARRSLLLPGRLPGRENI